MKSKFLLEQFMEANHIKYGEPFLVDTPSGKQKCKIEVIKLMEYTTRQIDNTEYPIPVIFIDLSDSNNWQLAHSNLLRDVLFNEKFKILKPVWKPKQYDEYYFIGADKKVSYKVWNNEIVDISLFLSGNCFKSGVEAKENKDIILKLREIGNPLIDLNEVE